MTPLIPVRVSRQLGTCELASHGYTAIQWDTVPVSGSKKLGCIREDIQHWLLLYTMHTVGTEACLPISHLFQPKKVPVVNWVRMVPCCWAMWHRTLIPAFEWQRQTDLWVWRQLGLQNEFQVNQGYTETLSLPHPPQKRHLTLFTKAQIILLLQPHRQLELEHVTTPNFLHLVHRMPCWCP